MQYYQQYWLQYQQQQQLLQAPCPIGARGVGTPIPASQKPQLKGLPQ